MMDIPAASFPEAARVPAHLRERLERTQRLLLGEHQAHRARYGELNLIWREVLETFGYVLHLRPEDILRLRMHSGLFVGEAPWQFWHSAAHYDAEAYAAQIGYVGLTKDIDRAYWVSESPNPFIPRPMGVNYRGLVINANALRMQSIATNLVLTGVWERVFGERSRSTREPAVVVEIGSGYGGLVRTMLTTSRRPVHFVAVDLPEILLFCCGYVAAADPEIDIRVVRNANDLQTIPRDRNALVLLSSFSADLVSELSRIDLAINVASFQEMRSQDIERYIDLLYPKLTGVLYSDNIDRHLLNTESPMPISQLLARAGAVFPEPGIYDEVVQANKWDWFYSTFLLGPQTSLDALNPHIRVFFGPMKQGAVMDLKGGQFSMVV
jgi:hypothetical protein